MSYSMKPPSTDSAESGVCAYKRGQLAIFVAVNPARGRVTMVWEKGVGYDNTSKSSSCHGSGERSRLRQQ